MGPKFSPMNTSSIPVPTLPANPKEADWTYFRRCFENYLKIVSATAESKLPLLLNCVGPDGLLIYDGLSEPKDTYEWAINQFSSYFTGRSSILLHRKTFFEARQYSTESITEFACRLRRLSKDRAFGTNQAELLRDIFIVGVYRDAIGESILARAFIFRPAMES